MIKTLARMSMLYDFYGALLTPKQHDVLDLFYNRDLSLGEIGLELGVSRQAVYDIIKRSQVLLEHYEENLSLVKNYFVQEEKMHKLLAMAAILREKPTSELWDDFLLELTEIKDGD